MLNKKIQDEVVCFAQDLVRQNSLSGREGEVAALVCSKMEELGYDQIQIDPYGSVIGTRIGSIPGPKILFDGHMDVVEVPDPQDWSVPPFSGEIVNGCIYGRGASDMKGPLAAAIVALGRIPREEFCGTLIVSASVNEEKHEGAALKQVMDLTRPDFVVICEPNGARLGVGQKGRAGITVDVTGKPSHSSVPHLGDNALYKAVEVIKRLREMELPRDEILGEGIMELIDGISRPYPSRSTLPVGFFMHYDRRLVQGEDEESVLASVRSELAGLPDWKADFQQIEMDTYTGAALVEPDYHPAWVIDTESEWVQKAKKGLEWAGLQVAFTTAKFCTNGSYSAGIAKVPTIIFGPSSGMLAHCQDEHISIAELLQGAQGYWGLARFLGE